MNFHDELKVLMHQYVRLVYKTTRTFPKEELYGLTSQARRASLSIILNYIEGFARRRSESCRVYLNFLEIAYGSLKESKYLMYFSYTERYIEKDVYLELYKMGERIG